MKKMVVIVMSLTLFSKILGFLRDCFLAYFYGTSSISDAFLIALLIPSVLFSFIGVGISTGYIPMYSKIESEHSRKEADQFTNQLLNLIFCLAAFIVIVCLLFTEPLVKIFASGFTGDTLKLAVHFTRITVISMFFTGIVYVFSSYLQYKGNYLSPSFMGLPLNIALILGIILSCFIHLYILPIGMIIATLLQFLFLFIFVHKRGFKMKVMLNIKSEHIRKLGLLTIPIILGTSVEQLNILVDRTIASNIIIGGISALNYSYQLILFVQGLFVSSIAFVYYPLIAKMATNREVSSLKETISQIITIISVILVPATVGLIVMAEPIVSILYGRGAFTNQGVYLTSSALTFYAIGLMGYGIREVINKVFYSLQDTKTPMVNAAIAMGINILLNIILSKFLGIGGLALATSISGILCSILLFNSLRKKIGYFHLRKTLSTLLKILIVSIVMGMIAKYTYDSFVELNMYIALSLSILIAVIFYFTILYFMRIEEVNTFIQELVKKKRVAKPAFEMGKKNQMI